MRAGAAHGSAPHGAGDRGAGTVGARSGSRPSRRARLIPGERPGDGPSPPAGTRTPAGVTRRNGRGVSLVPGRAEIHQRAPGTHIAIGARGTPFQGPSHRCLATPVGCRGVGAVVQRGTHNTLHRAVVLCHAQPTEPDSPESTICAWISRRWSQRPSSSRHRGQRHGPPPVTVRAGARLSAGQMPQVGADQKRLERWATCVWSLWPGYPGPRISLKPWYLARWARVQKDGVPVRSTPSPYR